MEFDEKKRQLFNDRHKTSKQILILMVLISLTFKSVTPQWLTVVRGYYSRVFGLVCFVHFLMLFHVGNFFTECVVCDE